MSGSDVIITSDLPTQVLALSAQAIAEADALLAEANALTGSDLAFLEAATPIIRRLDEMHKGISEQRLALTRPIDLFKERIIEAERRVTVPLKAKWTELAGKERTVRGQLELQRQEAERKARREAEERARAEQKRLEDERQAILKRQQEERAAAEAKAKEQADLFGEDAEPVQLPPQEPPPLVPAVVPVVDATVIPAALPPSAVRDNTTYDLIIEDESKIPVEIAGKRLMKPDEKAIKALWKAGVVVPGTKYLPRSRVASAGRRS